MAEQGAEKRRYGGESVMDGEMQRHNAGAARWSRGECERGDSGSLLILLFAPSVPSGSPVLRWHPSNSGETFPQLFL